MAILVGYWWCDCGWCDDSFINWEEDVLVDIGDDDGLDLSGWPVKVIIITTIVLVLACPALLMLLLLVAVPVTLTSLACMVSACFLDYWRSRFISVSSDDV